MGFVPPALIPPALIHPFRRRTSQDPKEDHPSTYPDAPARVDENVKTRPVHFTDDNRIIYPPQGYGSDVSDNPLLNRPPNPALDIIIRR